MGRGVGRERSHWGGWKLFEARGVSSRLSEMGGVGGRWRLEEGVTS